MTWKKGLIWIAVAIVALVVAGVIIAVVVISTPQFHNYVRGMVEQKASNALNAKVTVKSLNYNLHNLSFELKGIVVRTQSNSAHPLLTIDRAYADANIVSVFNREWYLNDLEINHPVVHIYVDKDGTNNLPKFQSSGGNSSFNLLQLGIRHALLTNGQVYYNDQEHLFSADLLDLALKSGYQNVNGGLYSGQLSYRNGKFQYGNYAPLPHSLDAKFAATSSKFTISPAVLSVGDSRIDASAIIQNYSSPTVNAQYKATLDAGQFRSVLNAPSLPVGKVLIDGTANYQSTPGNTKPLLDLVDMRGTITSPKLTIRSAKIHGDIRNLAAHFLVANGNAALENVRANVFGGNLLANATIRNLTGGKQGQLRAQLNKVSLSALTVILRANSANAPKLTGTTDATLTATWHGNLEDLNLNLDENVNGAITPGASAGSGTGAALAEPPSGDQTARPGLVPAAYIGVSDRRSRAVYFERGAPRLIRAAYGRAAQSSATTPKSARSTQKKKKPANASGGQTSIPITGHIHLHYSGKTKQLTFTNSTLKTPSGTIHLNGTAGKNSAMEIHLHSANLAQLAKLVGAFQAPKPGQPAKPPLNLSGIANFDGTLRGALTHPVLSGRVEASNVQFNGTHWQSLRANVQASSSHVRLRNATLVMPNNQGRINFNLSAGLQEWQFTPTSPLSIAVKASSISLAELGQLTGKQFPATGIVNVSANLHGTEESPVGQGQVTLTNGVVYGEPLRSAQINFQADGQVVNAQMAVQMPAGTAQANVSYTPKTQGYDATLRAVGIQLSQLHSQKLRNMKVAGVLNLTASGRGTLKNPELQASLQIPSLQVQGQKIQNVNLQAGVQNHLANFALTSDVVNTYVRAKGTVGLTDDYVADVSLDTGGIPLQPLFAAYMPAEANLITGQTELHASIRGPLKNMSQLQAQIVIPTLRLDYSKKIQLAAAAPIRADYTNGVLRIQPGQITGTGTNLRFQGVLPVSGNAPATLSVVGNLDMRLAEIFDPNTKASGQIVFDIRSTGTIGNPDIHGQVRIENAAMQNVGTPIGLQNANGVLTVSNNRVDITSFKGEVGGGTVTASGGVVYRPNLQFDLGLKANGISYVYQDQVRTGIDANLAFIGNKNASTLSGRVQVDRLSFTPDFDMTSLLTSTTGISSPPAAGTFADTVKLDITAQTAPTLNLVSQTLSVQGGANLRIQGTASQPVIVGRVTLTGGDVIFRGNRYVIQQGTIDFVNPNETTPVVNLAINTVIDQYNIAMRFEGPVSRLNTVYSSDPALPPIDILHLLAFGTTTEASAADTTPGTLGAESLLASGITGYGSGQLGKLAGLSYLSVDPVLGRTGQTAGARIEIQKRVTSNIYVTFATDVTSTQREEIQVQYQINRRWSISGNRDQNGGFGFDARLHKKF